MTESVGRTYGEGGEGGARVDRDSISNSPVIEIAGRDIEQDEELTCMSSPWASRQSEG